MLARLHHITEAEQLTCPDDVFEKILDVSGGDMRKVRCLCVSHIHLAIMPCASFHTVELKGRVYGINKTALSRRSPLCKVCSRSLDQIHPRSMYQRYQPTLTMIDMSDTRVLLSGGGGGRHRAPEFDEDPMGSHSIKLIRTA